MRINYFQPRINVMKETIFTALSPLQKNIIAIASLAIGVLVVYIYIFPCIKKIQNEHLIKKINKHPEIPLKDHGFKDIYQVIDLVKNNEGAVHALNLKGIKFHPEIMKIFVKYCSNLKRLCIEDKQLNDNHLNYLTFQKLEELDLSGCHWITSLGLCHLYRVSNDCTHLKVLKLNNCDISDSSLEDLERFTTLTEVSLFDCPKITEKGISNFTLLNSKCHILR